MKFPFFFASIYKSEVQEFGEQIETVFDETFWCFSDVISCFFWDFMEMIQFVSDHSDQISNWLVVVFTVVTHLSNLNLSLMYKGEVKFLNPRCLYNLIVLGVTLEFFDFVVVNVSFNVVAEIW